MRVVRIVIERVHIYVTTIYMTEHEETNGRKGRGEGRKSPKKRLQQFFGRT